MLYTLVNIFIFPLRIHARPVIYHVTQEHVLGSRRCDEHQQALGPQSYRGATCLDVQSCAGGTRACLKFGETNLRILKTILMKRKPKYEMACFFFQEIRI